MKSRLIVIALVLAVIGYLFQSCRPPSPDKEFRIGAVIALTGKGSTYGERALKGMQLAVDELNKTPLFQERHIKLIVEDSQSTAIQALSAFRKLVDLDHVPVAIGFVLSDEVLTCAPVANEKHVVLLTTAAGSDKIKDAGDYVFRNRESGAAQAKAIARACVEQFKFKEVAILYSTSANGVSYRDGFKEAIGGLGGTVSTSVGYNEGKTDYRAEIEQLRGASVRAVYLAGFDSEMGLILKQAKEVGFRPQFFASPGAISPKLLEIAGDGAEGLVCGSAPFNLESDDPHVQAFAKGFKGRFNEEPDWIAANSYDAIYLLANLFEKGSASAEQIKSGLYATKNFAGVGGLTTFDEDGEVSKPIVLARVLGGKFALMKPE